MVVPAGVGIQVYNGGVLISQTSTGLTAGKYYTITSVPTQGKSYATINGKDELVDWVQLWPGGPRFATKNVDEPMTWTEAAKKGTDFVWGKNWRTPNADEITEEVKKSNEGILYGGLLYDAFTPKIVDGAPSVKVEQKDVNNVEDDIVTFTGVYPGYTKTQLTLYNTIDKDGSSHFDFWTASEHQDKGWRFGIQVFNDKEDKDHDGKIVGFGIHKIDFKDTKYLVRPILAK